MAGCNLVFILASVVKKLTREKRGGSKNKKKMSGGASRGYLRTNRTFPNCSHCSFASVRLFSFHVRLSSFAFVLPTRIKS